MLRKKNRLSRDEFNRFFSLGKRVHSPFFTLVVSPYETLKASVVVSKKVSALAVERNKIRRRIYDIVRHYHSEYGGSGVCIFITKPSISSLPYEAVKEEVCGRLRTIMK